jgi:dolichol-phosphate mannosyltransferase
MLENLTAVTPMRNEEETAKPFLDRLISSLGGSTAKWHIIIPLTATDGTLDILRNYPVEPIDVSPGLGLAYSAGLRRALEYPGPVLTMDTDLSHIPEEVDRLISAGGDLVLGARESTKAPLHRRFISRMVNSLLLGPYTDYTSAYRLYTRPVLESVLPKVKSRGFAFLPEIVFRSLRAGFKVSEVKISFPRRIAGTSKMSYWSNRREYASFLAWRYTSYSEALRSPLSESNSCSRDEIHQGRQHVRAARHEATRAWSGGGFEEFQADNTKDILFSRPQWHRSRIENSLGTASLIS